MLILSRLLQTVAAILPLSVLLVNYFVTAQYASRLHRLVTPSNQQALF